MKDFTLCQMRVEKMLLEKEIGLLLKAFEKRHEGDVIIEGIVFHRASVPGTPLNHAEIRILIR